MTLLKYIIITGLVILTLLVIGWLSPTWSGWPFEVPDDEFGPTIVADDETMDRLEPRITLHWRPDSSELEVAYDAGCMASSVPVLGSDIRTRFFRTARRIEAAGDFLVRKRPAGMLATMDFGNCPKARHKIDGVPPGRYRLIWQGEAIELPPLGPAPLEIVLPRRDGGEPGLLEPLRHRVSQREANGRLMELLGPANERPDRMGIVRRVAPVPLLFWDPEGMLSVQIEIGCLDGRRGYLGHDIQVVVNRRDRIIDIRGDIRFLFTTLAQKTARCQAPRLPTAAHRGMTTGRYEVRREGAPLFDVVLGDAPVIATRGFVGEWKR